MSTTAQTPPAAALGLAHAPVQSAGQRKNRSVLGRPAQGGCSPGRILVPAVAAGTEQRRTVNRLRKAHGQLGAVIAAMQSGAGCPVLIPQLSAVRAALDQAGFSIISTAMRDCFTGAPEEGDGTAGPGALSLEEIHKLFLTLA